MRRRFNCVGGKVESVQRPGGRRTQDSQPEKERPRRPQLKLVQSKRRQHESNKREEVRRDHHPEHAQSPWDSRLRHPWVWAYRRVHGSPTSGRGR